MTEFWYDDCRDCGERIKLVRMPSQQVVRYEEGYNEGVHQCTPNSSIVTPIIESAILPKPRVPKKETHHNSSNYYVEKRESIFPRMVLFIIILFLYIIMKDYLL